MSASDADRRSTPEFRRDPLTGRLVIVAADRARRPGAFATESSTSADADCPFCEGREHETPGEVVADRADGTAADEPGWRVRVVPNKYPALAMDLDAGAAAASAQHGVRSAPPGPLDAPQTTPEIGIGVHDVIIDAPQHVARTSDVTPEQVAALLCMYRQRLMQLAPDRRLKYAVLFKNVGKAAGASIEHTHSQLMALPVVPAQVQRELDAASKYHLRTDACYYCNRLEAELQSGSRIAARSEHFVALCPYASRFPYEVHLVPRRHASHFESSSDAELTDCAEILHAIVRKFDVLLARCAYNYVVHSAPFPTADSPSYHWYLAIYPRLTRHAGFEWATGVCINPVFPEEAASRMRDAWR